MVGIVSFGAYVPRYRLRRDAMAGAWGETSMGGEKAVASFDEDSITMAVAAGINCLGDIDRHSVDALYFASVTSPYKEKQASSLIASALDLRRDIITADYAHSLRGATVAVMAAAGAIRAGQAKRILVLASDCRLAPPASDMEQIFGDGAVAILIGDSDLVATIEGDYSIKDDFIDLWRTDDDRYVQAWEDRFILSEGYARNVKEAVSGMFDKYGLTVAELTRAVFYGPDPRSHSRVVNSLGFKGITETPNRLFTTVGNTGSAFALMMLVATLEEAASDDKILVVNYGDGSDVLLLKVTNRIGKVESGHGLEGQLESKKTLPSYEKYLAFRSVVQRAAQRRPDDVTSLPQLWRDRSQVLSLHAQKCKVCGTVQFPWQRICTVCKTKDQFDEVRLADKKGKVFTYTRDYLVLSPDPPAVMGFVDFDGGGRMFCEVADADPEKVKIGTVVEMTFRRMHEAGGIHHYFWKCKPVTGGNGNGKS